MKKKNYYNILGVSRTESNSGIRTAYRQLAKRHHPDLAGSGETRHFQEITEAYCVLSDPEARADYNRGLQKEEQGHSQSSAGSSKPVNKQAAPGHPSEHIISRHEFRDTARLFDDFFEGFFGNMFGPSTTSPSYHAADLEILLFREEAEQGGVLDLPVTQPCPFCGGSSRMSAFRCSHCGGQGWIETGQSVPLQIPANVRDGSIIDLSIGTRDPNRSQKSYIRVLIRVAKA